MTSGTASGDYFRLLQAQLSAACALNPISALRQMVRDAEAHLLYSETCLLTLGKSNSAWEQTHTLRLRPQNPNHDETQLPYMANHG